MCCQAWWLEYLSQFNLRICFQPGRLGTKPNALTHCPDVHPGSSPDVMPINIHPLFSPLQLHPITAGASNLDSSTEGLSETLDRLQILAEISEHLPGDAVTQTLREQIGWHQPPLGWEAKGEHLWFEGWIYVPEPLCLQLIQNHHDHLLAGHFGHHKTINLIHHSYHWPGLSQWVKKYCTSNLAPPVPAPRQPGTDPTDY